MYSRMKTFVLLAALTALVLAIGYWLGGAAGLAVSVAAAVALNFATYWFSDSIVLRMYGARELPEAEAPRLHRTVRELSAAAGIPTPRVYLTPEMSPNAFATGRSPGRSAVAVTEGLLRVLDDRELRGVLAHELAHIKNRDTLVMTVSAALAGALGVLANLAAFNTLFAGSEDDEEGPGLSAVLVGLVVAPVAASIVQFAISRSREIVADETAAELTGDPLALARALRRIEAWSLDEPPPGGSPATAHLLIVNPFTSGLLARLFSTHPPTEVRIERLERLAALQRLPAAA
jgi:heat shock protein HtpX